MRCLSLAKKLRDNNHIVTFVCKKLPGSMISYIDSLGYDFKEIECSDNNQIEDANKTIDKIREIFSGVLDWIIVDHYSLDFIWQGLLSIHSKKIMVIDDLAN